MFGGRNNLGLHSPCSFCKQPNSQNSFLLQMNKVLYKYRMYPMITGLNPVVNLMDRRDVRCKFGMSCPQISSISSDIHKINIQFISLLTNLDSSQNPVEKKKLQELLQDTSRLYPLTIAEYRRVVRLRGNK